MARRRFQARHPNHLADWHPPLLGAERGVIVTKDKEDVVPVAALMGLLNWEVCLPAEFQSSRSEKEASIPVVGCSGPYERFPPDVNTW